MTIYRMLSYNIAHRRVLAGRSGVEHVSDIVVEKLNPQAIG